MKLKGYTDLVGTIEAKIYEAAGMEFNIYDEEQCRDIIRENLSNDYERTELKNLIRAYAALLKASAAQKGEYCENV